MVSLVSLWGSFLCKWCSNTCLACLPLQGKIVNQTPHDVTPKWLVFDISTVAMDVHIEWANWINPCVRLLTVVTHIASSFQLSHQLSLSTTHIHLSHHSANPYSRPIFSFVLKKRDYELFLCFKIGRFLDRYSHFTSGDRFGKLSSQWLDRYAKSVDRCLQPIKIGPLWIALITDYPRFIW